MRTCPDVLVLGGGGVLGEAWMMGVLSGLEDANKVDMRGAEYFVGKWTFEYLGAEYPPVSTGSRTGTAAFISDGEHFVTGRIDNDTGSRK